MSQNEQTLTAEVRGTKFKFNVTRDDYNRYINNVTQKEKIAPSFNFLMSTIDQLQKAELKALLSDIPGSEVQIAGALLEEYTPDLEIVVKKSSSAQTE